ncbi:hypothetical protein [Priestia megaterium]|uniref:hypothetical protein n=1 Tax=Priestia megaterium TaxID=1404 RepID=UPI003CC5997E
MIEIVDSIQLHEMKIGVTYKNRNYTEGNGSYMYAKKDSNGHLMVSNELLLWKHVLTDKTLKFSV